MSDSKTYFAQVTNDIVTDVRVVTQEFMDDNPKRYTGTWVETFFDIAHKYAGIGYTYDADANVFIAPCPYPSWTLDSNYDWQPPTPMPNDASINNHYQWNESELKWSEV